MSESVYVRARDGAAYKNPALLFEGGFIRFRADGDAELGLFKLGQLNSSTAVDVLDRFLGPDGFHRELVTSNGDGSLPVVVDGVKETLEFDSYLFHISRRIPVPSSSDGQELYAGRMDRLFIDFPAQPMDVHQMSIPD